MAGSLNRPRKGLMQSKSTNLTISKIKLDKNLEKSSANLFYRYLEKRNYIQGVVVLEGMLKCCEALIPNLDSRAIFIHLVMSLLQLLKFVKSSSDK